MTLEEIKSLPPEKLKSLISKVWSNIAQNRNKKAGVTGGPESYTGQQLTLPLDKKTSRRRRRTKTSAPIQIELPIGNDREKSSEI